MRVFTTLVPVTLVVAGAAVHGAATHRWASLVAGVSRAPAAHEFALPLTDFQSETIPSELPVKEKSQVTCRRYVNPVNGLSLITSITSGPPGAVATHTPDVCYPSSGYKTVTETSRETMELPGGGTATYFVADFEKKTATATDRQRIRWAWATSGRWDAPDRPRLAYLREPELFKVYIVTVPTDGTTGDPPAVKALVARAFAEYAAVLAK